LKKLIAIIALLFSATVYAKEPLSPEQFLYWYEAQVNSCYDADTCRIDIQIGFNIVLKDQVIRLYGINAWEVSGDEKPRGVVARDWMRKRVVGKKIIINTIKDKTGVYGRLLATFYVDGVSVNDELVELDHAVYKEY